MVVVFNYSLKGSSGEHRRSSAQSLRESGIDYEGLVSPSLDGPTSLSASSDASGMVAQ